MQGRIVETHQPGTGSLGAPVVVSPQQDPSRAARETSQQGSLADHPPIEVPSGGQLPANTGGVEQLPPISRSTTRDQLLTDAGQGNEDQQEVLFCTHFL